MSIRIVRLGDPRIENEGPRLGTVRRPPRGVKKEDFGRLDYYDLWLPDLAPSAELLSFATAEPFDDARWTRFARDYRREMKEPSRERLLQLLALLSHQTDFSVGCYCESEERCHRSLLRQLFEERGAVLRGEGR